MESNYILTVECKKAETHPGFLRENFVNFQISPHPKSLSLMERDFKPLCHEGEGAGG